MPKSSFVINITGHFNADTMRDALDAEYGAASLAHDLVTKLAHVTHASFGGAHYVAPDLFQLPKPPTDHRRLPPSGGPVDITQPDESPGGLGSSTAPVA